MKVGQVICSRHGQKYGSDLGHRPSCGSESRWCVLLAHTRRKDLITVILIDIALRNGPVLDLRDPLIQETKRGPTAVVRAWDAAFGAGEGFFQEGCFLVVRQYRDLADRVLVWSDCGTALNICLGFSDQGCLR